MHGQNSGITTSEPERGSNALTKSTRSGAVGAATNCNDLAAAVLEAPADAATPTLLLLKKSGADLNALKHLTRDMRGDAKNKATMAKVVASYLSTCAVPAGDDVDAKTRVLSYVEPLAEFPWWLVREAIARHRLAATDSWPAPLGVLYRKCCDQRALIRWDGRKAEPASPAQKPEPRQTPQHIAAIIKGMGA